MATSESKSLPRWTHGVSESVLSRAQVLSESEAASQWKRIDPDGTAYSQSPKHRKLGLRGISSSWRLLTWWIDAYKSGQNQEEVSRMVASEVAWSDQTIIRVLWTPRKALSMSFGQFCAGWAQIIEECDDNFFIVGEEQDRHLVRFGPLGDVSVNVLSRNTS